MRGRIAVLEHSSSDRPGVVGDHLARLGFGLDHVRVDDPYAKLPHAGEHDAVVVMGSVDSVTDDSLPWLAGERALVADCVSSGTPVLGICFGGQLLAEVLGGTVRRAAEGEAGWRRLEVLDDRRMSPGPWLVWHEDEFLLPDSVELLARSERCAQAFCAGPHLGVQFHPEIDAALLAEWFCEADARGSLRPEEAHAMSAGLETYGESSALEGRRLVERFVAEI